MIDSIYERIDKIDVGAVCLPLSLMEPRGWVIEGGVACFFITSFINIK